ncbi:beta-glucuronidase-like [Littorina saxatilis]|uniref:Beta-glucuronidase n=1 Tax=Littorina saxatilis TaxID=31220 RepID=A0AAN9FZL0_9CAEN
MAAECLPPSLLILGLAVSVVCAGSLYPRDSESRVVKTLDGIWDFRADYSNSRNDSFQHSWWSQPLSASGDVMPMPVPSSYNDIYNDKALRDFVGWVWYETQFFVPSDWRDQRVVLRLGSAHYYAVVWVNGQEVMRHDGGHLPFEGEVNSAVNFNGPNRLTVAVNNTLLATTLPPGSLSFHGGAKYPPHYFVQNVQMDFFNYAGIHRHVHLYVTPRVYVDDVTITTSINGNNGEVNYTITLGGSSGDSPPGVEISVEDRDGNTVTSHPVTSLTGTVEVNNARFWWPWTMKPSDPGYMYTLKVNVSTGDVYRQMFGIRTVQATDSQLLINSKPFYCLGVAKHEDADIRGKGLDYPLIARDFVMIKWLGANCFRTSHYPYSEEMMDQADQQGVVVIDESPAVGIKKAENFGAVSLSHHKDVMTELVQRDKNRPSVVMWSVANEPSSNMQQAEPYFKDVIQHTRQLDPTRPITFATMHAASDDRVVQFVDVISINRYYGWYTDTGHTEVIQGHLSDDLKSWRNKHHDKPILITEYGADTIAGMHEEPSFVFTEEYQTDFMSEYHKTFDTYRAQYLVGEMVWNFADFMTVEGVRRVVGNRKGVLTRQRQPKAAGHLLRARYLKVANTTWHTT